MQKRSPKQSEGRRERTLGYWENLIKNVHECNLEKKNVDAVSHTPVGWLRLITISEN